MANRLYASYCNPIQLFDKNRVPLPQYLSKFMDDVRFVETIYPDEQLVNFRLKWLQSDAIRLQYVTNYNPLKLRILDCQGLVKYDENFDTKQEDFFNPGFFARQADLDLAPFGFGNYELQVIGGGLLLGSEYFEINETAEGTLLIEFSDRNTYEGIIFGTPFFPSIRVPARLKYKKTAAKATMYEDQRLNEEMIKNIPYRIHEFILGGDVGVPPYLIDKVARIFGCSNLSIDGRLYARNGDGAEFEAQEEEDYPMAGWKIELREKINRNSLIYDNDAIIQGVAAAGLIVQTKGFGMGDNSGSDYQEINSLQ